MKMWKRLFIAATMTLAALAPAAAEEQPSKEKIEAIIHEYILDNPEILVEAMERLRAKERIAEQNKARDAIVANLEGLTGTLADPIAGNPDGDVTIVEFFDYRCPYCKKVVEPLMETIKADGNVRIVFKEFPILGPDSVIAARAALAAHKQNKYMDFHMAMMNSQTGITKDSIRKIAESVGIDLAKMEADMEDPEIDTVIKRNYELADAVGIRGTPAFIIGQELVPGAIGPDEFKRLIAAARDKSG